VRRSVVPGIVPVWVETGRWGPRHVRVNECAAIFRAERIYAQLMLAGRNIRPGYGAIIAVKPFANSVVEWHLKVEVVANAVWRRGRMFIVCRRCRRRAARLYIPTPQREPRCRRCWCLSYESQSWSYRPKRVGSLVAVVPRLITDGHRTARTQAAKRRYRERRAALAALPPITTQSH